MSSVLGTYARKAISFTKGEGSYLFTENGDKYLDFVQGIATNILGHCHEHLVKTIQEQRNINETNLKNEAEMHPFVKTVFENFPKASITEIKSQAQIIAEAEETSLPEIEGEWDPFEE